ncbi:MAG TPA: DUF6596 domain-containing protein [Polyangiaceae bacterium]|nr:DUF6596 domain-containing protein [Polyangiaceae bacterium]
MTQFDALYRTESRAVLATLVRLLGDLDLAEDAVHDAFRAAAEQWPRDGVPEYPRAWLIATGRLSALARLRRRARFDRIQEQLAREIEARGAPNPEDRGLQDDRLRLIFTCCHPTLGLDAQVALTLREVCGLTTEQIASCFVAKPSAIAQRIVRTKRKIREEQIPYEIPEPMELPGRLEVVLHVLYLVFNEGYRPSSGAEVTRVDLSSEAIELSRQLATLLPEPDALGLLALMLLHDARRPARTTARGETVLLADQDRSLWNREQIREGLALLARAWSRPPVASYTIQAAIAGEHAIAADLPSTNWSKIVSLYDMLLVAENTPVVELNRAAAISEASGPEAGLRLMNELLARGMLDDYEPLHTARGELLRRLGRSAEAGVAYRRALELTKHAPERHFLEQRLKGLEVSC